MLRTWQGINGAGTKPHWGCMHNTTHAQWKDSLEKSKPNRWDPWNAYTNVCTGAKPHSTNAKPLRKISGINRWLGHSRPSWWFARTIWWDHKMIQTTLADTGEVDPGRSILVKAGVKLAHPETYSGGSDLEEFETFATGILRWLKMNCLLGATSVETQVDYVGACLTGEAQEWFLQNMEQFNHLVCNWNLEMVMQGLQKRFLHTLNITMHHTSLTW